MEERWKPLTICSHYEVSSLGRIRSLTHVVKCIMGERTHIGKILKLAKRRYVSVCICINGKSNSRDVHRLVANEFVDNPLGLKYVHHINHNKHDNRAVNLRWVTQQDNTIDAFENNLIDTAKGERQRCAKLKNKEVIEIKRLLKKGGLFDREIGEMFNVTRLAIWAIKKGKTWKHI